MSDPVFYHLGGSMWEADERDVDAAPMGWYFYIETWADVEGPFTTEDEARRALVKYAEQL